MKNCALSLLLEAYSRTVWLGNYSVIWSLTTPEITVLKGYKMKFNPNQSGCKIRKNAHADVQVVDFGIYEPRHEKTEFLHMRKQRRRSVVR